MAQPKLGGGKKLIYTHKKFPLTCIDDFEQLGKGDDALAPHFAKLHEIVSKTRMLWNHEAEKYLLENFPSIDD